MRLAGQVAVAGGLFVALLLLLDLVVPRNLYERSGVTPWRVAFDRQQIARSDGKVYYTGDSVLIWRSETDRHRTTVGSRLRQHLGHPLVVAARPAKFVDAFVSEARAMIREDRRPALFLVAVDLFTFDPVSEKRPGWDLGYELAVAQTELDLTMRGLAVFKYPFGRMTPRAWERQPIVVGGESIGTVGELERWAASLSPLSGSRSPEVLRRILLPRLGFDLASARQLQVLEELVSVLETAGFPSFVYLTPLPMDQARAVLSPAEMALVDDNVRLLRGVLASSGLAWVDLTSSLGIGSFEPPWPAPSPHLVAAGREALARQLAEAILAAELLPPAPETGPVERDLSLREVSPEAPIVGRE